MATVLLTRRQCRDDDLPRLCAKCGEETDNQVDRRFVWCPSWVFVFIFVGGLLPLLIAYLLARKKMRVRLPVCERHAGDWARMSLFGWLSVLGSIVLFVTGLAMDSEPGNVLAIVGGVGFVGSLIAVAVWSTFLVRPTEINEDGILLTGVDKGFAAEVKELRRGGREDDEYDDDRPRRKGYDEYDDRPRRPARRDRYDDEDDDRRRDRD